MSVIVSDSRLCWQSCSLKDTHTHTPKGQIRSGFRCIFSFLFFFYGPCLTSARCLPAVPAWHPFCKVNACLLFPSQSCLDRAVWIQWRDLCCLSCDFCTSPIPTRKKKKKKKQKLNLFPLQFSQWPAVCHVCFWSLDTESLDGHRSLVCGVCVCACTRCDVCWPQAKRFLPLPPLILPCFICSRSPSLPAHPPWTGSQGAEEAEGRGQAKARCRCDLGLLAGTQGTFRPHGAALTKTAIYSPPRPSSSSATIYWFFLSVCFSISHFCRKPVCLLSWPHLSCSGIFF